MTGLLRKVLRLAVLVAATWSGQAAAGVDCSISVTGVAFGTYDGLISTPDDSNGSVTVTCNYVAPGSVADANYTIALSTGLGGNYGSRNMFTVALSRLGYNLYTDAARTLVWGNGTGGTQVISGTLRVGPGVGNGTRTATYPIYGRIPALQAADTGNYGDFIQLTLTY